MMMQRYFRLLNFAVAATLGVISTGVRAELKNFQPANSILGRTNFTAVPTAATDATRINQSLGLAVDPATGKLFVSDTFLHRVLRFSSSAAYRNGSAAEAVFGQDDFISDSPNQGGAFPLAGTLKFPGGIVVDRAGNLWVADAGNNRVLRFANASTAPSGSNSSLVLGQANFFSEGAATSQAGMASPNMVAVDSSGRLWVADAGNHRVLAFAGAAALANGASANLVLGQTNFTNGASGLAANRFNAPLSVTIDAFDRLWVCDRNNNRILRFNGASTKANGANADAVLGQTDLVSNTVSPASATTIERPNDVNIAADGTLWVSEQDAASRVIGFKRAALKGNGAAADIVLGQPDFDSNLGGAPTNRLFLFAIALASDAEGGLFVSIDSSVLRFSGIVKLKAPSRVNVNGSAARVRGTSEHASTVEFRILGRPGKFHPAAGSAARWSFRVRSIDRGETVRALVRAVAIDRRRATKVVKIARR